MTKHYDLNEGILNRLEFASQHVSVITAYLLPKRVQRLTPKDLRLKKKKKNYIFFCVFDPGCDLTFAMSWLDLCQCPEAIASLPSVYCLFAAGGQDVEPSLINHSVAN